MAVAGLITGAVLVVTFATLMFLRRASDRDTRGEERSPVPWLSDVVWRQMNPQGFLARRQAGLSGPVVRNPDVTEVSDDDRRRAPLMPAHGDCSPEGDRDAQHARLLGTPGAGSINSPVWPWCCRRLATLVSRHGGGDALARIEAHAGALDRAYLDAELRSWGGPEADIEGYRKLGWSGVLEQMRSGEHSGEGINVFHCRACGRVYVASSGP